MRRRYHPLYGPPGTCRQKAVAGSNAVSRALSEPSSDDPFALCRTRWLLCVFLASIGYLLSGCGYQVVGSSTPFHGTPQALFVEPFTNLTRIPRLEIRTAYALRQSILKSQTFSLVQAAQAQQYIQGTVQQFRQVPISFDSRDNAQQYRIEADILLRLVKSASRTSFFEQKITAWAEYLVSTSGDVRETAVARETAIFQLAQQFASQSVSLLTAVIN